MSRAMVVIGRETDPVGDFANNFSTFADTLLNLWGRYFLGHLGCGRDFERE